MKNFDYRKLIDARQSYIRNHLQHHYPNPMEREVSKKMLEKSLKDYNQIKTPLSSEFLKVEAESYDLSFNELVKNHRNSIQTQLLRVPPQEESAKILINSDSSLARDFYNCVDYNNVSKKENSKEDYCS